MGKISTAKLTYELPVYKASFDLLSLLIDVHTVIPRMYKYTIGECAVKSAQQLLIDIVHANKSRNKSDDLNLALDELEMIKMLMRLGRERKCVSTKLHTKMVVMFENIGKQLNSWSHSAR